MNAFLWNRTVKVCDVEPGFATNKTVWWLGVEKATFEIVPGLDMSDAMRVEPGRTNFAA